MRIDLRCPYSDKDEAKALGARWDVARKTWYVIDPDDLEPFSKWIGHLTGKQAQPKEKEGREKKSAHFSGRGPFVTVGSGYVDVAHPEGLLPWEDEDPHELISLVRAICS